MTSTTPEAPILANVRTLRKLIEISAHPNYEALLELQYRKLIGPGDTVVDIGAHTGRHTRVFAELVGSGGHVLAFEPVPLMYETLVAELGAFPQVTCIRAALGNANGTVDFVHAVGTPEESGLRARARYNVPELADPHTIQVEVRRLDEFADAVDAAAFIKIDIEGGELDCLAGGERFVNEFRPILSVEYGHAGYSAYGHEQRALFDYAQGHDYVITDLFGFEVPDESTWAQVCDSVYWDFFLIPRRRIAVADRLRD